MNNNEITLGINTFIDHFKESNTAHSANNYIFFENPHNQDSFNKIYTITDGFLISFLLKGKVEIEINYVNYIVESPAIISIFPNSIYEYYKESEDAQINSLFISVDCMIKYYYYFKIESIGLIKLNPTIQIPENIMFNIQSYIYHLQGLYGMNSPVHNQIVELLLHALVIEINDSYFKKYPFEKTKKKEHQENKTRQFFELLRENRPLGRGVAFYAEKLNISSQYLSICVKNTTKRSAIKWINYTILLEAKKMLCHTDMSIQQISEALKFESSAYFSTFFKKETGVSPLLYRKEMGKHKKITLGENVEKAFLDYKKARCKS